MVSFQTTSIIIGFFLILAVSFYTVIHIFKNREEYGTQLIAILNMVLIVNGEIIYSIFFVGATVIYFSVTLNIIIWKFSMIFGSLTIIIALFIYSYFNQSRKLSLFTFLIPIFIMGLLIGTLINSSSVILTFEEPFTKPLVEITSINYKLNHLPGLLAILGLSILNFYFLYISANLTLKSKETEETIPLLLNSILFIIPVLFYIFYLYYGFIIFRNLHIILLWITFLGIDIMLIRNPEMFFILPNQIYSINIYHKSGILLYSYDFDGKSSEEYDSNIWGNVLIGLNHILSEFAEKSEKIDVIQTRKGDVMVQYDNQYGFAIMLITNRKNATIQKLIRRFAENFKKRYQNELNDIQDLNRIINVANFLDTKNIIENTFRLYLPLV